MEKFRNLSKNIFFKIFLGFLGLTFVMWGVGDFILSDKGSWIAKVDNNKIPYKQFITTMQNEKEIIYRANPQEQTLEYLNSQQFKSNILNRLIAKYLIKLLQDDFEIYINENLVLEQIAVDPNFRTKDGKFNRHAFTNFLNRNHLTEKKYINDIKDQIISTIIIDPLIGLDSANQSLAKNLYEYNEEKRMVDVVTISTKNIGSIKNPNNFELIDFFEKNKSSFALPQMRKVLYIAFKKEDIAAKISTLISKEEITNQYQNNLEEYQIAQTRDFYHLLFDDADKANDFLESLKRQTQNPNSNIAKIFAKLAFDLENKDQDAISLTQVAKTDLFKEITQKAFAIHQNQYSEIIQSPIGFHIFYLLNINPASKIPLAEVKDKIKTQILAEKQENLLIEKLNDIEDELLVSNSLDQTAKKFGLKVNRNLKKFNIEGLDSRHNVINKIKGLDQFVENSFNLAQQETSKLFYSKSNSTYYTILIEEINPKRQRSLDEVKVLATDMWINDQKQQELQKLSEEIAQKIKNNGGEINAITTWHNLKIEKNRQFPRFYSIDLGKGKTVPHSNDFLDDIFSLNINQVSSPHRIASDRFIIGVVRKIEIPSSNKEDIEILKQNLAVNFKNNILTEYNNYIQNKFPVQINDKLIQNTN